MSMIEVRNTLSPAKKAWATRRARAAAGTVMLRGETTFIAPKRDRSAALAAFEQAATSDNPDWHAAALALKAALIDAPARATAHRLPRAERPKALPAPAFPDYPVDKVGAFNVQTDMLIVTFADGQVVRAPAVSTKGKPTNVGRGLRIAIAFYQFRQCRRRQLQFLGGPRFPVPAITSCVCEPTGEVYAAELCTLRTIEDRRGHLRLAPGTPKVRKYLAANEIEGGQS